MDIKTARKDRLATKCQEWYLAKRRKTALQLIFLAYLLGWRTKLWCHFHQFQAVLATMIPWPDISFLVPCVSHGRMHHAPQRWRYFRSARFLLKCVFMAEVIGKRIIHLFEERKEQNYRVQWRNSMGFSISFLLSSCCLLGLVSLSFCFHCLMYHYWFCRVYTCSS